MKRRRKTPPLLVAALCVGKQGLLSCRGRPSEVLGTARPRCPKPETVLRPLPSIGGIWLLTRLSSCGGECVSVQFLHGRRPRSRSLPPPALPSGCGAARFSSTVCHPMQSRDNNSDGPLARPQRMEPLRTTEFARGSVFRRDYSAHRVRRSREAGFLSVDLRQLLDSRPMLSGCVLVYFPRQEWVGLQSSSLDTFSSIFPQIVFLLRFEVAPLRSLRGDVS